MKMEIHTCGQKRFEFIPYKRFGKEISKSSVLNFRSIILTQWLEEPSMFECFIVNPATPCIMRAPTWERLHEFKFKT